MQGYHGFPSHFFNLTPREGIAFEMGDGRRVLQCLISHEALRQGDAAARADYQAAFERRAQMIEKIAARLCAAGRTLIIAEDIQDFHE